MFNRTLQVKMIKTNKEEPKLNPSEDQFEGKAKVIGYYFERFAEKVGTAVITYVLVDTIRKVLIAKATNHKS